MKAPVKHQCGILMLKIIQNGGGNWCYASRDGKLAWLDKLYNTHIKYRMLGYHLADLVKEGLFKRIRRTHREANGTIILLTAAYCATIKGCKYYAKHGVSWAKHQLKKLRLKYIPPESGKPQPIKRQPADHQPPDKPGKNLFKDPLWRKTHGLKPIPLWKKNNS